MKTKLNAVIDRAVDVITQEIRAIELDDSIVPVVLNVGTDPETDGYLSKLQAGGTIHMFVDIDDDDDEEVIPDIIIFSGDKIGMESGLEFLCDTSVVIVEENDHKALRRRNTSAIHAQAGKFSNFVYLDNCNPNVIVYSNSGPVITEVSRPLEPEYDEDALANELSFRGKRETSIITDSFNVPASSVAPTTIDYFRRTTQNPSLSDKAAQDFVDRVNKSADEWNDLSNTDALDLGEDDENEDQDA